MPVLVVRPQNRSSVSIGCRDNGCVGHVHPLVIHEDLIVAVTASPVTVLQRATVAEGTAGFAAPRSQLLKPAVHFGIKLRVPPVWITSKHLARREKRDRQSQGFDGCVGSAVQCSTCKNDDC